MKIQKSRRFLAPLAAAGGAALLLQALARPAHGSGAFPGVEPSARIEALGGQLPASIRGGEAVLGNPAGLLDMSEREVRFAYADLYGLGLVSHSAVQIGWPVLDREVRWTDGEIRRQRRSGPARRSFGAALTHIGTNLPADSYGETEVALAYAFWLPEGFRCGVDYRLLWSQSSLATAQGPETDLGGSGHAIDLGIQRPLGPFRLGLVARNLASTINWNRGQDEPLSRRWTAGLACSPLRVVTIEAHGLWVDDTFRFQQAGIGVELRPVAPLAFRSSVRDREDALGRQSEWAAGASFALWRLAVDYSYASHAQDLGETQRWNLGFRF